MSEIKLKPCPFCGGEAVAVESYNYKAGKFLPAVMCIECNSRTTTFSSVNYAIESWNTRKPVEKILERLEEERYWTPSTYDIDGYCNDDSEEVIDLDKAIEIIKEEVG